MNRIGKKQTHKINYLLYMTPSNWKHTPIPFCTDRSYEALHTGCFNDDRRLYKESFLICSRSTFCNQKPACDKTTT